MDRLTRSRVIPRVRASLEERFWAKTTEAVTGCLVWTGAIGNTGYGRFKVGPRNDYAHRVAYRFAYGDIPDGMEVDHLCESKRCVNPEHLEAVTHIENSRRSRDLAA